MLALKQHKQNTNIKPGALVRRICELDHQAAKKGKEPGRTINMHMQVLPFHTSKEHSLTNNQ